MKHFNNLEFAFVAGLLIVSLAVGLANLFQTMQYRTWLESASIKAEPFKIELNVTQQTSDNVSDNHTRIIEPEKPLFY